MAVFGQQGHGQLHRAGSDLGNGLKLLRVLADRVVLAHAGREYYLPLLAAPADAQRPRTLAGKRPATALHPAQEGASNTGLGRSAGTALQAGNVDEVRQQCQSSTMAQLSATQRQEIQALGLCP
jgi:hypothetical protein